MSEVYNLLLTGAVRLTSLFGSLKVPITPPSSGCEAEELLVSMTGVTNCGEVRRSGEEVHW